MDIVIRDGCENMDWDAVAAMLATAYWSEGIQKEEVQKGAVNSALTVGAFSKKEQVGYLRVISDKTRFAYILDVFVKPEFRKKGIAGRMLNHTLDHPEFTGIYQWMLITRDAHKLYKKHGFVPITRTDDWMEIKKPKNR